MMILNMTIVLKYKFNDTEKFEVHSKYICLVNGNML